MLSDLQRFLERPPLYAESTDPFWDGDHISKGMLEAHLNAHWDAATRPIDFVRRSVEWIAEIAPPQHYPALLDLGCGPGIYAERFAEKGYAVTGVDFSKRSIAYAREQTASAGSGIVYHHQNYLEIDYEAAFDIVTLIYCDFGVLSTDDRRHLLLQICKALRAGGVLVVDVFTPLQHAAASETREWAYYNAGSFWSVGAHLCLNSFYRYDADDTVLTQTIVVAADGIHCYNIWEHCFTASALTDELAAAGFGKTSLYGDVGGSSYSEDGKIICAVASK